MRQGPETCSNSLELDEIMCIAEHMVVSCKSGCQATLGNAAAGGRHKQDQGMTSLQWKVSMLAWCGLSQQRALSKGWRMAPPSGSWYGASSSPSASWSGCSCRAHLLNGLLGGLLRLPHNCSLPTKHPFQLASAATAVFGSSHGNRVNSGQKSSLLITEREEEHHIM